MTSSGGDDGVEPEAKYERRNEISEARNPEVSRLFRLLQQQVYGSGGLSLQLKREIFMMTSIGAGCQHCQSHAGRFLDGLGTPLERIQALWEFEWSNLFNAAERAALRIARDAALVPTAVTPEHFVDLRRNFTNAQIGEILDVMCISAFLNRWHNTLAMVTDQDSVEWAQENLAPVGWRQVSISATQRSGHVRPGRRRANGRRPRTDLKSFAEAGAHAFAGSTNHGTSYQVGAYPVAT